MKIKVKLFSILSQYVANYDPAQGLEVDLPSRALVADLIRHLNIPEDKKPVVSCDGRILKADDPLSEGGVLHIFQPVSGG